MEATTSRAGRIATLLYVTGLAFLFTHELDAVAHGEWRLLFVLRAMPDADAQPLFIGLHLPLFLALLWLGHQRGDGLRRVVHGGVAAFLVLHAALHWRLRDAPEAAGFAAWPSQLYIFGAALVGLVALAWLARGSRRG